MQRFTLRAAQRALGGQLRGASGQQWLAGDTAAWKVLVAGHTEFATGAPSFSLGYKGFTSSVSILSDVFWQVPDAQPEALVHAHAIILSPSYSMIAVTCLQHSMWQVEAGRRGEAERDSGKPAGNEAHQQDCVLPKTATNVIGAIVILKIKVPPAERVFGEPASRAAHQQKGSITY